MYNQTQSYSNINNLIGHWDFNQGNGSALEDLSETENDGTISGASWSSSVPLGCTDQYADNYNSNATVDDGSCAGYPDNGDHVLSFDGQDDYLSISGVDAYNNLGDFSFSVWVKVPQSLSATGSWDNAKAIINKDHYPVYGNATYNLWFLNGSYVGGVPDNVEALAFIFDPDGNTIAGNDVVLYTEKQIIFLIISGITLPVPANNQLAK